MQSFIAYYLLSIIIFLELPPLLLRLVVLKRESFVHDLSIRFVLCNHLVDGSPIGQSADVAVVDPDIGFQFSAEASVLAFHFLWEVFVDGVEFDASLPAPFHSIFEELPLANGPKDEFVTVFDEHPECLSGERQFLANIGITMFDDSTIKVNCYGHNCLLVFDSGGKGTKNYP